MEESVVLKYFEIDVDTKKTLAARPFTVVEGDTGNVLVLRVYDGGGAVDLTGCSAAAVFSHSRGVSEQDSDNGGLTIDGNELTIALLPSSFAPGLVECEVQIFSGGASLAARNTLITCARFNFSCRRAIVNGDSSENVPQFPILSGLISEVETAEAARQAAETARAAAETARASAEAERVSAEAERVSAESARAAAESLRAQESAAATAAANAAAEAANSAISGYDLQIGGKVDKAQGAANAGTVLAVGADGSVKDIAYRDIANAVRSKQGRIKALCCFGLNDSVPIGEPVAADRAASVTASASGSGITGVSVDAAGFVAGRGGPRSEDLRIGYSGTDRTWKLDGRTIALEDHGLYPAGTPANGDRITVSETTQGILLKAADRDKLCGEGEHSVILKAADVLSYGSIPFSNPQLLIYAVQALPAGTYRFTISHGAYGGDTGCDGTYCFTTAKPIPAGGGIRHSAIGLYSPSYSRSFVTTGTVTTYGAQPAREQIEYGIAVSQWDGVTQAADLGTVTARESGYLSAVSGLTKVNYTERSATGSARYAHSNIRKWLNSSGKAVVSGDSTFSYWWEPSNEFDMPPADANVRKAAGFLHGLDPALLEAAGEASIVCHLAPCDVTDPETTEETLSDRVFLPSRAEIYGVSSSAPNEGSIFALYEDAGNSDRIHYNGSTATACFLRTCAGGSEPSKLHCVGTDGALGSSALPSASAFGIVPCMIIKG